MIYSQLVAQKEAFDEVIDLEIGGSGKDAESFARQQATKDYGNLLYYMDVFLRHSFLLERNMNSFFLWVH